MNEYVVVGLVVIGFAGVVGVIQPVIKLLKSLYDAIAKNTQELIKLNEKNAYISKIIDNHENRLTNHEERINQLEVKGSK